MNFPDKRSEASSRLAGPGPDELLHLELHKYDIELTLLVNWPYGRSSPSAGKHEASSRLAGPGPNELLHLKLHKYNLELTTCKLTG